MNHKELIFEYCGSKQKQKDFLRFHLIIKKQVFVKTFLIILLLLGVSGMAYYQKDYFFAIGGLALTVFLIVYCSVTTHKTYKKSLDASGDYYPRLIISFGPEELVVTNTETNETVRQKLEYIDAVYAYRNYLFVYLDCKQALCLEKSELVNGDIALFLENNPILKDKYHNYKRSRK